MRGGSERTGAARVIELWREPGGPWAWRYREAGDPAPLRSNENYDRREEAVESARRAYPGVPIQEDRSAAHPGRALVAIALVAGVAVALPVLVVFGLILAVRLAVKWRRFRRRLGKLHPST